MLYVKISITVLKIWSGHDINTDCYKGAYFRKKVGRFKVIVFSISSDDYLYFSQVLQKYLIGFLSYKADTLPSLMKISAS